MLKDKIEKSNVPSKPQNEGLPNLDPDQGCTSWFEFMPTTLFYLPIFIYAFALMVKYRSATLPARANPAIYAGGAIGERKSDVFSTAGLKAKRLISPYCVIRTGSGVQNDLATALKTLTKANLVFPIVAKPDTGLRGSGVRPIHNPRELESYLRDFPSGRDLMLQKKVDHPAEAGVFYIRYPGKATGYIFSLTLKYRAVLKGDGRSTLRELIMACPRCRKKRRIYLKRHRNRLDYIPAEGEVFALTFARSHAGGAIFRDGSQFITPQMEAAIDSVAKDFKDLHFARFDIRFDTLSDLQKGGNFKILEVNGIGAEATHIWDCRMSLWQAYKILATQWRHAFAIGDANRKQSVRIPGLRQILSIWLEELTRADDYPLAY